MTKTDQYLIQNLSELKEITRGIQDTNKNIQDNLKVLNDNNILHATQNVDQHKEIMCEVKNLTTKYWWLILGLLAVVLIVLGYKEAVQFIKVG